MAKFAPAAHRGRRPRNLQGMVHTMQLDEIRKTLEESRKRIQDIRGYL